MRIALCYESVLPQRGGCETYIADLTRRLARDGHDIHLLACRWDESALPAELQYHRLHVSKWPRFTRPWRFAQACLTELAKFPVDVSVGFDKTYGQDVLYPQGGLHVASAMQNIVKFPPGWQRTLARWAKAIDPAGWSFRRLERRQYLSQPSPTIVANSEMVRGHFRQFYPQVSGSVRVVRSAIDPGRFVAHDRLLSRHLWRKQREISASEPVGLFLATNYRLKGLAPLIAALPYIPSAQAFTLVVAGNDDIDRYDEQARALGIRHRVVFAGFCPEPRDAYFAADFLVHPTFYDPCSLVALEALACGLPVVTTRFNGASELVGPSGAGIIVDDPHNPRELANAITALLNPQRRSAAARAARAAAAAWTFEDHYRALLEVLIEVAARKAA